jgi:hypothetical protein
MSEDGIVPRAVSRPPRLGDAPGSYLLTAIMLAAALVALLWVPSYAKIAPTLAGFPFFYWYSLLWLLLNAVLQLGAYQLLVARPRRRAAAPGPGGRPR